MALDAMDDRQLSPVVQRALAMLLKHPSAAPIPDPVTNSLQAAPSFPEGRHVTIKDNQGRTRTGTIRGVTWQDSGSGCLAGRWYWIESTQGDSWTHESRISQSTQGAA